MAVEVLFKKAFERLKDRYLNFLIVTALGWVIGLGIALVFGLSIGATLLTWALAKNTAAVGIVATATGLISLGVLIYFSAWAQLATIDSLVDSKKITPFETYKKVKPLVKDYVVLTALLLLFFLGLLPFTLLSVLIVGLVWAVWSIFTVFVFLDKKKKGLESLWISRDTVNQKFWPVVGVALLVIVLSIVISALFASSKNGFIGPLISQLVLTPFITSLYFEMYKTLKAPAKGKKPKVWVGLSIVGLVAMAVLIIVAIQTVASVIPGVLNDKKFQQEMYKELQKSSVKNSM